MLKPAIMYKEELEKRFAEELYSDDYFFYSGYPGANSLPDIKAVDDIYRYVIVQGKMLIGYFCYRIDRSTDTACAFGLYSFDRGNTTIGKNVYAIMRKLVKTHRRVEWRMISGNPVQKIYDRFCRRYSGNRVILHSVVKDDNGQYHDEYIYEILGGKVNGQTLQCK